jgi:hypothetical protein
MKEWKVSREVLASFDDRLDNLRKYGFTFLTALLAADSILLPASAPAIANSTLANTTPLPDPIKLAVLIVNLLLIVALQFIDRNYQVFLRAAASRATVLERILNLELTDVISQRYNFSHVGYYMTCVYFAFVFGVGILGYAIFTVDKANSTVVALLWLAVGVSLAIIVIQLTFSVDFPYGTIDWTIDPLQCQAGEKLAITITNLEPNSDLCFERGEVLWEIRNENNGKAIKGAKAVLASDLSIKVNDSHTWLWDTNGISDGIYEVHRAIIKREFVGMFKEKSVRRIKRVVKRITSKIRGKPFNEAREPIGIKEDQIELLPLSRKVRIVKAPKQLRVGTGRKSTSAQV